MSPECTNQKAEGGKEKNLQLATALRMTVSS